MCRVSRILEVTMKSAVKTLAIWLCVVVLQCLSGTGAKAQSNNPCIGWANNGCVYGWTSAPCPGWFNCYNYGPWLWTCQTWTNRCAPAVKDEVKQHCPVGGGPVCFADGNTYIEETDARIPGFSNGLSLVRTTRNSRVCFFDIRIAVSETDR